MSRPLTCLVVVVAALQLAGCDMIGAQLGIESPEKVAAARDADGRAIGGACRHAGRAIEDCYTLNRKADKAAVFAGWRDMNDYMRENKIEAVAPQLANAATRAAPAEAEEAKPAAGADKPAVKGDAGKSRNREVSKSHDS
jgi:hypothetical protein